MGLMSCTYPPRDDVLELLREFEKSISPLVIDVELADAYALSKARMEGALRATGREAEDFTPLASMERNAAQFGPQYRIALRDGPARLMEGAINRRVLTLTWDDPMPQWAIAKILLRAHALFGGDLEAEDDAGSPIDIRSLAQTHV